MDATAYHLEARAPFHFGLRGVGIEATALYGPSDTLFSALCHGIRQQFGLAALQDFLGGYAGSDPPAALSSALPYVLARREEEVENWRPPEPFDPGRAVRFFPRPIELAPPGVPAEADERKTVKKIGWVSEGIFRAWIAGDAQSLAGQWAEEVTIDGQTTKQYPNLIHGQRVWLTAGERERVAGWRDEETDAIRLWAVGDVPRVTVDRGASTSAVYQAGQVWFQPGGGLWLLVRWREDWRERGELALQALGHAGIGGERSAGHGLYRLHGPHKLSPFPDPEPGGRCVTLSLYYPTQAELPDVLTGDGVNYRFMVRRGWMASPDSVESPDGEPLQGSALRRKAVRMVAEGSILRWPGAAPALGGLADATPDAFGAHRVYRYGLAWAVGYRPAGGAS
jgi:CRISPR type III-A-associated RAMP protein Csm4